MDKMKLIKAEKRAQWKAIHKLYEEAFPEYEKKPFWLIRLKNMQGRADAWYIEEEGNFIGLGITMSAPGRVLLDYFAAYREVYEYTYGKHVMKNVKEVPYP